MVFEKVDPENIVALKKIIKKINQSTKQLQLHLIYRIIPQDCMTGVFLLFFFQQFSDTLWTKNLNQGNKPKKRRKGIIHVAQKRVKGKN